MGADPRLDESSSVCRKRLLRDAAEQAFLYLHVEFFPLALALGNAVQDQSFFVFIRQHDHVHARQRVVAKALELGQHSGEPQACVVRPMQAGCTCDGCATSASFFSTARQHRVVHSGMLQIDQVFTGIELVSRNRDARASIDGPLLQALRMFGEQLVQLVRLQMKVACGVGGAVRQCIHFEAGSAVRGGLRLPVFQCAQIAAEHLNVGLLHRARTMSPHAPRELDE